MQRGSRFRKEGGSLFYAGARAYGGKGSTCRVSICGGEAFKSTSSRYSRCCPTLVLLRPNVLMDEERENPFLNLRRFHAQKQSFIIRITLSFNEPHAQRGILGIQKETPTFAKKAGALSMQAHRPAGKIGLLASHLTLGLLDETLPSATSSTVRKPRFMVISGQYTIRRIAASQANVQTNFCAIRSHRRYVNALDYFINQVRGDGLRGR